MPKKMSPFKKALFIFMALGILCGTWDLMQMFGGSHEASAAVPTTTTLTGKWDQTKSGIPDSVMTATISNAEIQIIVKLNDGEGIYWLGTFDSDRPDSGEYSITSQADQDAMNLEVFASQDSSKLFYYHDGDLSFPYSVYGQSTIVHLSKETKHS